MFKKLMVMGLVLTVVAAPALAERVFVTGGSGPANVPSDVVADFEWNTMGVMNSVPTSGGTPTGWAAAEITAVQNTTGQNLTVVEFGFPCDGPGPAAWYVWLGIVPPGLPGAPSTASYTGTFTPATNTGTPPPTVYANVNVSGSGILWPVGTYLWFGYENPGYVGLAPFSGVTTWGWYLGAWDPDANYQRTAVMQVKANFAGTTATDDATWGQIKRLYQ